MQVECSVDETDIGKVKENQKVTFTVDAYPEKSFTGTVTQVRYSPEIIQNVVTYTTIVEVKNPNMMLRPGMTATVSVIVDEAMNTLRIPNSALLFTPHLGSDETKNEDISQIWTVDENGTPKPIPIKTGVTDSSYTEVIEGTLQEGQMVITGFEPGAESNQSTKNSNSMRNMMRALS
jgi:HlyD family secretion protein